MVYLIPNYSVSYGGKWYHAGEKVEISTADIGELSKHGMIHEEKVGAKESNTKASTAKTKKK